MTAPLSGLRILEIATEIAGPYAGKLFADAGADVVKVEPSDGDPMRRHTASGTVPEGDSALFQFLNTSKRSLVSPASSAEVLALAAAADVIIVDSETSDSELEMLQAAGQHSVVVSITPFGRRGPWVGTPATEFTLQASCGSSGGRGVTGGHPLAAGGRLGEWIGGAYAAVAAIAFARRAQQHGVGEFIDVSLLEAMTITMGGLGVVAAQINPTSGMPSRSLELPSIEPTADGYVGFCTITGQQFQDFLVLIERFEWLDDPDLASFAGRLRRREEFSAAVRAWTTKRTTAEVIEAASALRIPVAPIGSPNTVMDIDHFVERGVFVRNPAGFAQPRPPYRIEGAQAQPFAAAPAFGNAAGALSWPMREREPADAGAAAIRPLSDLRILDLTAFWAGPSGSLLLASLGADVIKVEGVKRPDGMRYAGGRPPGTDQWWETGSIFLAVNENKRGLTLELGTPTGHELALQLIKQCDVVMENFSPRVMTNLDLDWNIVSAANPAALMVRMPAFGLDGPWRDRVGFAQTMEQVSGMAWMTGEADGSPVIPRGACDPIAGLHAAFATIVALEHRRQTGAGALVEVTMVEAALNVAAQLVVEKSAYGDTLMRAGNRGSVASPQGIYGSAGDDAWVAIAVVTDAHWQALCAVTGAPELAKEPALAGICGRRDDAARIDELIAAWTSDRTPQEATDLLQAAGIPAAVVTASRDLLANPQLVARRFFQELDHPVIGSCHMPSLPLRLAAPDHEWLSRPAPTLGQHNGEILTDLLGQDSEAIAELSGERIIGTRPAGL
jgi:crotonobetainyl-CoA:carnitine CoA-transferase CaiB-like acyl-CoA transferase